jgi:hypothetical protein
MRFCLCRLSFLAHRQWSRGGDGATHKPSPIAKVAKILMYADDTVIFLKPIREEFRNLADIIVANFTGLCTNIAKRSIAPIKWESPGPQLHPS